MLRATSETKNFFRKEHNEVQLRKTKLFLKKLINA